MLDGGMNLRTIGLTLALCFFVGAACFAADHCCDNFSFGRAAFSQPVSGVRIKSDLHYFATRISIY